MSQRVKPGEMAQEFELLDINGELVRLSDFRKKAVLLSFFRDAKCPFCNLRLFELTSRYERYRQQGLEIIAIFNSSPKVMQKYLGKQNRPFPVLSDTKREIFELYGVESSWGALFKGMLNISRMLSAFSKGFFPGGSAFKPMMPADFLIDHHGKVRGTYYSRDSARHIPLQLADNFISSLHREADKYQTISPGSPDIKSA